MDVDPIHYPTDMKNGILDIPRSTGGFHKWGIPKMDGYVMEHMT